MKIIRRRIKTVAEANANAERAYLARKRAQEVSERRYLEMLRKDEMEATRKILRELDPSAEWMNTGTGRA